MDLNLSPGTLSSLCRLSEEVEVTVSGCFEKFFKNNPPGITEIFSRHRFFIAGAGGLGSNVAHMIVRSGAVDIVIADFDVVSESNLNRQFYFYDQIGMNKTDALCENLIRINPDLRIEKVTGRLSPADFKDYIDASVDLVFECFDNPASKAELTRFCLSERPDLPFVAVSGIGGDGPPEEIKKIRKTENFFIVGDERSDCDELGTLACRVTLAAALQVHAAMDMLKEKTER